MAARTTKHEDFPLSKVSRARKWRNLVLGVCTAKSDGGTLRVFQSASVCFGFARGPNSAANRGHGNDQTGFESNPPRFSLALGDDLSQLVHQRAAGKPISDARTATYVILSTGSGPGGWWFKSSLTNERRRWPLDSGRPLAPAQGWHQSQLHKHSGMCAKICHADHLCLVVNFSSA